MSNRLWVSAALAGLVSSAVFAQGWDQSSVRQRAAMENLASTVPGVEFLMSGPRLERIYGRAFATGGSAQDAAAHFMAENEAIFGAGVSDFEISGVQDVMNGKFTAVYFKQISQGLPVLGGNVTLLSRADAGEGIVLAVNGSIRTALVDPTPKVSGKGLIRSMRGTPWIYRSTTQPELVIYNDETQSHLAWTFIASNENKSEPVRDRLVIDAHTGEMLARQSQICYVDVSGTVKGYATPGLLPDQANNPAVLTNLFGAKVTISGGATGYADTSGAFTLANAGSSAVTVNSTLEGRWVRVVNNSGTTLSFSGSFTPPGPANFVYNPTPSVQTTSQVNGLIHTTAVHDFVKSINSSYPGVDIQMPCNVNVAGSGNAFYDGSSINFYNAGGVYPNTCYTTVVYHEYGHHIVQSAGTAQNGYGEGMGDVTASLLANTNELGADFRGQGTGPLRNAYNSTTYPSSAEIHTQGQILSGAFWLTLDQLKLTLSTQDALNVIRPLWLNSILLRPTTISPAITVDVLTLDDNDAVLGNGTPHYQQIKTGFNPKGLTAPNLDPITISPQNAPAGVLAAPDTRGPIAKKLSIYATFGDAAGVLNTASPKLFYAMGSGSFASVSMVAVGGGLYRGDMPRPGIGQGVRYYFEGASTTSVIQRQPLSAPATNFQFVYSAGLQTLFADTFETNLGWTVANDASLTTGAWVRANPNGSSLPPAANPEDDSSDAGAQCYFTGQAAAGAAVGTADVDGGPTRLISPTFSLAGGNGIVEYSRWFFNDDGDDSMTVEISNDNGTTWVTIDSTLVTSTSNSWTRKSIIVGNYIAPTATMKLRVSTSDNPNDSITEAAIDDVLISRIKVK